MNQFKEWLYSHESSSAEDVAMPYTPPVPVKPVLRPPYSTPYRNNFPRPQPNTTVTTQPIVRLGANYQTQRVADNDTGSINPTADKASDQGRGYRNEYISEHTKAIPTDKNNSSGDVYESGQDRVALGNVYGQAIPAPVNIDDLFGNNGNTYGNTNVSGQATAILGNNYGRVVNIYNYIVAGAVPTSAASFLASGPESSPEVTESFPEWVVRQNQTVGDCTVETVSRYTSGGPLGGRGAVSQLTYHWYWKEDLGGGLHSEVYREERSDHVQGSVSRAVKVLRRRPLQRLGIDYKRELNALIQLSQPSYHHLFIEFFGWYEHHDSIFITMEYASRGDLSMYISHNIRPVQSRNIIAQILEGLRVMHRLDFVHRDIKPANILVFEPAPLWHVKIGDFGITKNTMIQHASLHTNVGTEAYKAPEVVGLVLPEDGISYNAKCDIWSLGCVWVEILCGDAPFRHPGALQAFCADTNSLKLPESPRPLYGRQYYIEEALRLLKPRPQDRPNAENVFLSDVETLATNHARQIISSIER